MGTNKTPIAIKLTKAERTILERTARATTAPYRKVLRAGVILLLAAMISISEVARQAGLRRRIVKKWQVRFEYERLAGLEDKPRSGRPARFPPRSRPLPREAGMRAT